MKLTILLLVLVSAIANAADEPNSLTNPGQEGTHGPAAIRVSPQFEEADISLAVAQYKRLKELAFELHLKLELEEIKDADRDALARRIAVLHRRASELRFNVESRANESASAK